MNPVRFAKFWYIMLGILFLAACVGIGFRDTYYLGDKNAGVPANYEQADWWAATVMLRTKAGAQWCSGVVVNNEAIRTTQGEDYISLDKVSFVVTAKHCTDKMHGGTVSHVSYLPDGSLKEERPYRVLQIWNHKSKDFAVMMVEGHMPFYTPIYVEKLPADRQDFIIGYRGDRHGDKHKFGKYISPAYAYKGQSGGGVFAANYGLHAVVSTHVDGVNIFKALKDMTMEDILTMQLAGEILLGPSESVWSIK